MRVAVFVAAALACAACGPIQGPAADPPEYNGAYAILDADPSQLATDHLETLSDQAADVLRAAGVRYIGRGVADGVLRIRLERTAQLDRAVTALSPISGHLAVSTLPEGVIELRVSEEYAASLATDATEDAIEVIRRRVARLGPPVLVEQYGPNQIIVRTTETELPEILLFMITQRGRLTFHLVKEIAAEDLATGRVPAGSMLVQPLGSSGTQEVVERRPRLVDHISAAHPSSDPITGEFVVAFRFDEHGTRTFCAITREHTGERFAMLLDDRVITAPRINEPICGGSGQISGNFTAETAQAMVNILMDGALPLPFTLTTQGVGEPPAPPTP